MLDHVLWLVRECRLTQVESNGPLTDYPNRFDRVTLVSAPRSRQLIGYPKGTISKTDHEEC